MTTENRLNGAFNAVHAGFNRVAARVAGLSFWQFVLLAIVLLAAAGIAEGLWDKSSKRRVRITDERTAGTPERRDAKARGKEPMTAEIRIDQDGVVIRRKAHPEDQGTVPPAAPPNADVSAAPGPGTAPALGLRAGSDVSPFYRRPT